MAETHPVASESGLDCWGRELRTGALGLRSAGLGGGIGTPSQERARWAEALQELCPCTPANSAPQGSREFSRLHPSELRRPGGADEAH